ncbi:TIGR04282 family arsenosugar biosynthesis glycosyltransferase [Aureitalea sp. L0-47]|uniref:TIGR04282 family arsenosugar biosynthesis glycosyltransferase n=1 Tax=Aureitalea sp. L0-47 TaxID=2816962 RepID=UPI0022378841|nr:TIGR04282 family arsenosugar biosynthesis glycosyltransferase [Aureitalea sp. L0-47]MCW5518663.1 TIGR04282 family arsenosugar biosynthesis glycosyltransferase [Aureitalea sp. L0-47]
MNKALLLIFTRNPELGKVKTRLAATIGAEAALKIYNFLLNHTFEITRDLTINKHVYYSETIWEDDIWQPSVYEKKLQSGDDLGDRMKNAFERGFKDGYEKIVIIGSDIYDISSKDIESAFEALDTKELVIGEAQDGGYYLLGMNQLYPELFENKQWGTNTVFNDTVADFKDRSVFYLPMRNDIDLYEDLLEHEIFNPYTKANEVKNQ